MYALILTGPFKKKKQTIGWLSLANFYSVSQWDLGSNKLNL